MRNVRADYEDLQRYIGHRPSSILSQHYDEVGVERLRDIADLAQQLFEGSGAFAETDEKGAKNAAHLH